jgi:hypothetical protein
MTSPGRKGTYRKTTRDLVFVLPRTSMSSSTYLSELSSPGASPARGDSGSAGGAPPGVGGACGCSGGAGTAGSGSAAGGGVGASGPRAGSGADARSGVVPAGPSWACTGAAQKRARAIEARAKGRSPDAWCLAMRTKTPAQSRRTTVPNAITGRRPRGTRAIVGALRARLWHGRGATRIPVPWDREAQCAALSPRPRRLPAGTERGGACPGPEC